MLRQIDGKSIGNYTSVVDMHTGIQPKEVHVYPFCRLKRRCVHERFAQKKH